MCVVVRVSIIVWVVFVGVLMLSLCVIFGGVMIGCGFDVFVGVVFGGDFIGYLILMGVCSFFVVCGFGLVFYCG